MILSKSEFDSAVAAIHIRKSKAKLDSIRAAGLMLVHGHSEKEAAFELGVKSLVAFAPAINLATKIKLAHEILDKWRKNKNKTDQFKWQSACELLELTATRYTSANVKAAAKIKVVYGLDCTTDLLHACIINEKSRNSVYVFEELAKKALAILDAA